MSKRTKQGYDLAGVIKLQNQLPIEISNYVTADELYKAAAQRVRVHMMGLYPQAYGETGTRESCRAFFASSENLHAFIADETRFEAEVGSPALYDMRQEAEEMLLAFGRTRAIEIAKKTKTDVDNATIPFDKINEHPHLKDRLIALCLTFG